VEVRRETDIRKMRNNYYETVFLPKLDSQNLKHVDYEYHSLNSSSDSVNGDLQFQWG